MRTVKKAIFSLILVLLSVAGFSAPEKDSLRFEILMTTDMLKAINLNPSFIGDMEITSGRHLMVATNNQFYLIGWGGLASLGKQSSKGMISSFAFTPDSLLLFTRGNELCYLDENGTAARLYTLPYPGMKISSGREVMYLYGPNQSGIRNAVYALSQGGGYAIVLETTTPVNDLLEHKNSLILASGNRLCRFDLKTKESSILATLSEGKEIISVTNDPSSGMIYFSTDKSIYAVNDTSAMTISDIMGGVVRCLDGGLVIFDHAKRFMMRIAGIENELRNGKPYRPDVATKPAKGVLTNADVAEFVANGLSDALIITIIRKSEVDFDLSINSMIGLAGKGVSSDVIMEMRSAMKRKDEQRQNN